MTEASAPLKVAVIGLGYFSRFHLDAWQRQPGCELAGLCDRDANLTARIAAERGVPGFDTPGSLLEVEPDIVDLVVPPAAQAGVLGQCLRKGRIIICQKPFGRSLAEAEAMTEAVEKAGAVLVIHENFRFQPWHRTIRRWLDEGRLGQVYGARFALRPGDGRGVRAYLDRQPSFQTMEQFLIRETGVHFIDLFRWLFGAIESVQADLRRLNPAIRGEDAGVLTMRHRGGVQSVFDGNRLADHVAENPRMTMGEMVIEGEEGTLTLDGFGKVRFRAFGAAEAASVPLDQPVDADSFGGGCVAALIGHVVAAVRGEGDLENTAREYLEVIRVCEAAYHSDETGRRIALDEAVS